MNLNRLSAIALNNVYYQSNSRGLCAESALDTLNKLLFINVYHYSQSN